MLGKVATILKGIQESLLFLQYAWNLTVPKFHIIIHSIDGSR